MKKLFSIACAMFFIANVSANSGAADSSKTKEKSYTFFNLYLPGSSQIQYTPFTQSLSKSQFEAKYGPVKNYGMGMSLGGKLAKNMKWTMEVNQMFFKLGLCEPGGTVSLGSIVPAGGQRVLPQGMRYKATTSGIRVGARYYFGKKENMKPWFGISYGLYLWNVSFPTWDEKQTYGSVKGNSKRLCYGAGIDFIMKDVGAFSIFLDANAPVAPYSIPNFLGTGYPCWMIDGQLYSNLRFGIALGV